MNKVISFSVQKNFQILIQFHDGETKLINFKPLIGKGISAPLLDEDYFSLVSIDNGGGLEWPNGMDF